MFSLISRKVYLAHAAGRQEDHGPNHVLAMDLKFSVDLGNDALAEFHPRLKTSFYWHDPGKDEGRDLADKASLGREGYLPDLLYPQIAPLAWDHALVGATVTIHAPVSKNDIVFEGCQVDRFLFDMKQGGTVSIGFRVIVKPKSEVESGRLLNMMKGDVSLSVIPPKGDLVDAASAPKEEKK